MHHTQASPQLQVTSTQSPELAAVLGHFAQLLPRYPHATNDFKHGLYQRQQSSALEQRYLQWQAPGYLSWLLFDVDTPEAGACWIDAGAPTPNLIVQNPSNGHAKVAYLLAAGVAMSNKGRATPKEMYERAEKELREVLGADPNFRGGSAATNNPTHPSWAARSPRAEPWSLGELLLAIPGKASTRRISRRELVGEGRNCALFESLRSWAYPLARQAQQRGSIEAWRELIEGEAARQNALFQYPLGHMEVRRIAKSVTEWTWENAAKLGASVLGGPRRETQRSEQRQAMTPEEARQRMAQGGQYIAQQQRDKSGKAITEACRQLAGQGNTTPTHSEIARAAGLSTKTVQRFYAAQRAGPGGGN